MAYDYFDYTESAIDDLFDDVIVDVVEQQREKERKAAEEAARIAARQRAGAADYSGVLGGMADVIGSGIGAIGSGIGGLYSGYGEAVGPSLTGYYGDTLPAMNDQELASLLSMIGSGDLMASNIAGIPDSYVLPTEERNLMTEGDYIFPAVSEDIFLEELYDYDPLNEFLAEVGVGPGSGYDPRDVGTGDQEAVGGDQMGPPEPEEKGFFSSLLGALGLGGLMQGGLGGLFGNLLGSMLGGKGSGSPLIDYLMMKSLLKDQPQGAVPVGQQAYGQAQPFSYQAYQPTNLQPALMPGVAYANVGAPGMMDGGGVKSLSNKNRPGDITFAKLEPGEFVIRREAVDAVGIPTLEQINAMGG